MLRESHVFYQDMKGTAKAGERVDFRKSIVFYCLVISQQKQINRFMASYASPYTYAFSRINFTDSDVAEALKALDDGTQTYIPKKALASFRILVDYTTERSNAVHAIVSLFDLSRLWADEHGPVDIDRDITTLETLWSNYHNAQSLPAVEKDVEAKIKQDLTAIQNALRAARNFNVDTFRAFQRLLLFCILSMGRALCRLNSLEKVIDGRLSVVCS